MPWFGWSCVGLAAVILLAVLASWSRRFYLRRMNRRPVPWWRAFLGRGLPVSELARRLGLEAADVERIEVVYFERRIAKKRGGTRRLLVPATPLKALQRRLLHRLLRRLKAHPAAHGFERGRSIVSNARPHERQAVVIKMDIVDFFSTTPSQRVEFYFRRIGWDAQAAALLTRICTHDGGLPQGAPTSPRLSNLVNYAFDARLDRFVRRFRGTYTRYADDITISFPQNRPRKVRGTIQYVRRLAKAFGYRIHLRGKLRILRQHQQQRVTGLVVNCRAQLPREVRRRLRAVQHHLRVGRPATLTVAQLEGWLGLLKMIDQ
ncbi:MAG: reverse transcriptase family protein [Gemmataceae bacterium]|nr:reverse transcriptase family protein [Gemmataceae bacterium]